jgi:hypothetical protein
MIVNAINAPRARAMSIMRIGGTIPFDKSVEYSAKIKGAAKEAPPKMGFLQLVTVFSTSLACDIILVLSDSNLWILLPMEL